PVGEVREGDHADRGDAHHPGHDGGGAARGLQRPRQQHDVEGTVFEVAQHVLDGALGHRNTGGDAGEHGVSVDLDAVAVATTLGDQVCQQRAVAAAQVEHARALRNHAGDDLE